MTAERVLWFGASLASTFAAFGLGSRVMDRANLLTSLAPAAVRAEPAPAAAAPAPVWATGKLEAQRQAIVGSKTVGRIESYVKSEGDVVQAGEPVVLLERSVQEAFVREAQAKRDQALRDRERDRRLRRARTISARELEEAETAYLLAEAELEARQAALDDGVVKAPFPGRILKTFREAGESVAPGSMLFAIGDLSHLKVRAEVDELDLGRVKAGAVVRVWPDAYPGQSFGGTVNKLSGMLGKKSQFSEDPGERVDAKVLEAEILLNPSEALRPGMTTKVEIEP